MRSALSSFGLIALLTVRAWADPLAVYNFDGSSRGAVDVDSNSVATLLTDGPGFKSSIDTTRGNGPASISVNSMQADNANAVTAGDYLSFTISPTSGFALDLTNLSFDFANYTNKKGSKKFPVESFFVRSSLDNFGSNLATQVTATKQSAGKFNTASITLGPAFNNATGSIEFRIYVQDNMNKANRGALLDNITLNGTTIATSPEQVPEPAVWMLMGVGLLIGAQGLRRKRI